MGYVCAVTLVCVPRSTLFQCRSFLPAQAFPTTLATHIII